MPSFRYADVFPGSRYARGASLAVLAWLGAPLKAQQPDVAAPAESAAVARAAWARSRKDLQARDVASARRELDRAAAAWPTQQAYVWGRADAAALGGDTAAVLEALSAYAALGLGRDAHADAALTAYLGRPEFAPVVAQLDANREPIVRSRIRARLADPTFWPEGMDADPRSGRFFVASVRHRTIAVVMPEGPARELWPRNRAGIGAVLGVRVDTLRDALWATLAGIPQMDGYLPADSTIAALVRVDPSTGRIEQRFDLPAGAHHVLGDLALGPNGDVFTTDSDDPVLYRLRPDADTLEAIRSPLFRSLQGLAPTPDGRFLYLADYSHGLLRVDLRSGDVIRLDDAPHSTSLGCDGIAWDRGTIIAVQNGVIPPRIVRFVLDPAGTRITRSDVLDRNLAVADEPTIGAVVNGEFVYVANSHWEKYRDDGVLKPGARLMAPVLLAVPLPP